MRNEKDYVFKGYIVNSAEYDNGNKETSGTWLYFPTDKETVKNTFEEIGLPVEANADKYFFDTFEGNGIKAEKYLSAYEDVDELNYLANCLYTMSKDNIPIFETAATAKSQATTQDLINMTYNAEYYTFVPEMYSWAAVGKHFAEQNGCDIKSLDVLEDFIDYEGYGEFYANHHCGELVNHNYIETNFDEFDNVYLGGTIHIPKEYIVTQNGENIQYDDMFDYMFSDSVDLATELDDHFRNHISEYSDKYPDSDQKMKEISDSLILHSTVELKQMLKDVPTKENLMLLQKISVFEREYPCDIYMIYQIRQGKRRDLSFEPLADIQKRGIAVDKANYELIYTMAISEHETLEDIFTKYNKDIPEDFKGHSLSISDIVVLRKDGKDTAYYCDRFGFVEVPEFNNVNMRSACYSNYKGYTAFVGKDNNVYLGKSENYIQGEGVQAHYNNADNSLIFISENEKMYGFLYSQGWVLPQDEMLQQGYFAESDYAEFSRLQKGVLSSLDTIRNITFAEKPFNYLETAEKTKEQNYNHIDGQINNEPSRENTQEKPSIKKQLAENKKEHGEQGKKKQPHHSPPEL